MKIEWNRALMTLGVVAALAMVPAALARDGVAGHGADDQTQVATDRGASGEPDSGTHGEAGPQEAADDHGTHATQQQELEQEHATHVSTSTLHANPDRPAKPKHGRRHGRRQR